MRLNVNNIAELPHPLIQTLSRATHVAVLTGAGVSAESGIPTFRGAQTGIWEHQDPMKLASPEGFEADPGTVWKWYQWRRELISANRPNAGHEALARMQRHFNSFTLITQNVDGLHQLAGSENVLELHGNIHRNICSETRRLIQPEWIERHIDRHPPPSPHHREGLARPDVVWFGEALDVDTLDRSFAAAAECELMLIVGTAGAVQPAASIPVIAHDRGTCIIDINPEISELTGLAEWHLAGPSAIWLPALVDKLRRQA